MTGISGLPSNKIIVFFHPFSVFEVICCLWWYFSRNTGRKSWFQIVSSLTNYCSAIACIFYESHYDTSFSHRLFYLFFFVLKYSKTNKWTYKSFIFFISRWSVFDCHKILRTYTRVFLHMHTIHFELRNGYPEIIILMTNLCTGCSLQFKMLKQTYRQ